MSRNLPLLDLVDQSQAQKRPALRVGDGVKVHFRIREGEKERVQIFQGTIIRIAKGGAGESVTVRKVSYGVGVERIFPIHSPRIEKIEVLGSGHVRRSRLYYLRDLKGKKARLRDAATADVIEAQEAPATEEVAAEQK